MQFTLTMILTTALLFNAYGSADVIDKLISELNKKSAIASSKVLTLPPWDTTPFKLAIDAGPAATPYLNKYSFDSNMRGFVGALLAYVGGDEAIESLYNLYRHGDHNLEPLLCLAVSSRGNKKDISFLLDVLTEQRGNWLIKTQAALALGVLRAKEAIPDLQIAAESHETAIGKFAAISLRWINEEPVSVNADNFEGVDKDVISSIFINGLPDFTNSKVIRDVENNGFWRRKNNEWTFHKLSEANNLESWPTISLDIHVSPDKNRAFATVAIMARYNSCGFNYIFHRNGSGWRVVGICLTLMG